MSSSLAITVASRQILPKADTSVSDCEDSIAIDLASLRFAVADGATEGFDSRRWSRYLTRAWVSPASRGLEGFDFVECVPKLGQRLEEKWTGRRLPWYLEEKAAGGSFAAFVGLHVTPEWTWSAVAIGDCCLVIERNGAVEQSFPLSSADDFSTHPILVASKLDATATKQALRFAQGVCLAGDVIMLMSDAVACWYLGHAASNRQLLEEFHGTLNGTSPDFASLIDRERTGRRLRNDDVAVLKLAVSSIADDGN